VTTLPAGSTLDLEFTLDSPSRCFRFVASGFVTRTERHLGRSGMAVKLRATRMETI
jgi:hypothetical protein